MNPTDVLILGAGSAGLTAALSAAAHGLRVTVLEASDAIGGTSATSAGSAWVPGNALGHAAGLPDDPAQASNYLTRMIPESPLSAHRDYFVRHAAPIFQAIETQLGIAFVSAGKHPDYLMMPGAAISGRVISPPPFDGRQLGHEFSRLRAPMSTLMAFGSLMLSKDDLTKVLARYQSWSNFQHTVRLLLRWLRDLTHYSRGARLTLGNALMGNLMLRCLQRGIVVQFGIHPERLLQDQDGRVVGVYARDEHGARQCWRARRGVVLATGGIGSNQTLRREWLGSMATARTLSFAGNLGGGTELALAANASMTGQRGAQSMFWQPVSDIPKGLAGDQRYFAHLALDRGKPGLIAVNRDGKRFTNEANSYHHFAEAILQTHLGDPEVPAHLVCDTSFVQRYGLGLIPPGSRHLARYRAAGYLVQAHSPDALARKLGLSVAHLRQTLERANASATHGTDPDFGKGTTPLNQHLGDPKHPGNPCLAPMQLNQLCAVAVRPAVAANSAGLHTDIHGRVLQPCGQPIGGLYAVGNDRASIMEGHYPGPGITLGPGMMFAYLSGKDLAAAEPRG